MSGIEQRTATPEQTLVLDLLYPAVLGAMIVFVFFRFAASGIVEALTQPPFHFGVILGVFYALGFVTARLSPKYNGLLALVDFVSAILMFICFYTLGLNEEKMSQQPNYGHFYWALLLVVLSPMIRRFISFGREPHFRNRLSILAAAVVGLALAGQVALERFSWLTPWIVVILLYLMLLAYVLHIPVRGLAGRAKGAKPTTTA
jgi:hypothetical protein